jgi:CheY-like chemotaxis protein
VIKNQIRDLDLTEKTEFLTNGQDTIDRVSEILDATTDDTSPIKLMLLDFQMPKKNGI